MDSKLIKIIVKKERSHLNNYVSEISNMQEMMLECKIRSHNKMEDVERLEREFGKIRIN